MSSVPRLASTSKPLLTKSIVHFFAPQSHYNGFFIFLASNFLLSFYFMSSIGIGRYTLNIWDVGGQKTIRSYWRNYFEQTDGLVWVVDSSDLRRLDDCKLELDNLLKEEVCSIQ